MKNKYIIIISLLFIILIVGIINADSNLEPNVAGDSQLFINCGGSDSQLEIMCPISPTIVTNQNVNCDVTNTCPSNGNIQPIQIIKKGFNYNYLYGFIILFCFVFFIILFYRRRKKEKNEKQKDNPNELDSDDDKLNNGKPVYFKQ